MNEHWKILTPLLSIALGSQADVTEVSLLGDIYSGYDRSLPHTVGGYPIPW